MIVDASQCQAANTQELHSVMHGHAKMLTLLPSPHGKQRMNRIVHHALLASLRTREKRGDKHRKGHSPRLSCGKMWAACDSVGSIPH